MLADPYRSPIPPQLWDAIRDEFGLPALGQVRDRLEAGSPDRNRRCASSFASSWTPARFVLDSNSSRICR
jgi:hypothetical protein